MSRELGFNNDDLRGQANAVRTIEAKLRNTKAKLVGEMSKLRSDWNSDAGRAFFTNYDDAWSQEIDRYCDLLEELAQSLQYAADSYTPLEEEFGRIHVG